MTKQQVLHRVGQPEKKLGDCWIYREDVQLFRGGTLDAERVCFVGNQYSTNYQDYNGKWVDQLGKPMLPSN